MKELARLSTAFVATFNRCDTVYVSKGNQHCTNDNIVPSTNASKPLSAELEADVGVCFIGFVFLSFSFPYDTITPLVNIRFRSLNLPLIPNNRMYDGSMVNFPETKAADIYSTNPALFDFFLRRFGIQEAWVLMVGCGSGDAAIAAAYFGMNSICVDTRQTCVS